MDKSLRPTCYVCLEVPLTVTFTVINEADSLLWTGRYSESENSEEDKSSSASPVRRHSMDLPVQESIPVSDGNDSVSNVEAAINFDPVDVNNCNLVAESEQKYIKSLDHTQIQNCTFRNEAMEHTDTPSMNGLDHQFEIDDRIVVMDEPRRRDILFYRLPSNRQELSFNNLASLSDSVVFPVASQSLQKPGLSISQGKVTMHSKEQFGEANAVSIDLLPIPWGIPIITENGTMQKKLHICNIETASDLCPGIAESSLNVISRTTTEEIRELTGNNLSTSVASDSFKQKDEKSHLDPGYFTEEGNEGSKDDLHVNNCVIPDDSVLKASCDETTPFDNGFHDEYHKTAARRDGIRPKFGILKHSKTSVSFDLHTEHLPISLRENWTGFDALYNTMPSKTVAFCEQQLPKQKWDYSTDTSEAMDRLRAITSHLCLPVIFGNQGDGLKEHHSHQKVSQLGRFTHISDDKDKPLADDPRQNLTLTFQDISEFITGIEQELFQIRKSDDTIASQLLALYTDIRQYKYTCNCQLYREMMETAIENEDKKDELSRHHVDTIPERLCATLKQWGLTRINLQRRRFSIF